MREHPRQNFSYLGLDSGFRRNDVAIELVLRQWRGAETPLAEFQVT